MSDGKVISAPYERYLALPSVTHQVYYLKALPKTWKELLRIENHTSTGQNSAARGSLAYPDLMGFK